MKKFESIDDSKFQTLTEDEVIALSGGQSVSLTFDLTGPDFSYDL